MTKFDGLFCCDPDCPEEAEYLVIGNLNNGMDNDTHACTNHVGSMLGTPDFLQGENSEWSVSLIPETELAKWRTTKKNDLEHTNH